MFNAERALAGCRAPPTHFAQEEEQVNHAKSLARKQKSVKIQKARDECKALVEKQQPGHLVEYVLVVYLYLKYYQFYCPNI